MANIKFIYDNHIDSVTASTAVDYHPGLFVLDWLPEDITYWRASQSTGDLTCTLDQSRNVKDMYIIIQGENWHSYTLQYWDGGAYQTLSASSTDQSNGDFKILVITSDVSTTKIKFASIDTNDTDVFIECGMVVLGDEYEALENPKFPFVIDTPAQYSSYRTSNNMLVRFSGGTYKTYSMQWEWISSTFMTTLTTIYRTLQDNPILMTLGTTDTDWRVVGLSTGQSSLIKEYLPGSYFNTSIIFEDIVGSA